MVVGFGLLLFVGILVSDHFSTAQKQENANLVSADRTRDRVSRPVSIAAMPVAGVTAVQPAEVMPGTTPSDVRRASNESTPAAPKTVSPDVRPIPNLPNAPAAEPPVSVVDKSKAEKGKTPKVQESEPGVRLHPIAEGETLYSICAKTYGDGSLWKELAEYNKKALPNPTQLRKGVTLRLPPVEQLRRGGAVASTNKGARVNAAPASGEMSALKAPSSSGGVPSKEVPLLAAADIASVDMNPAVLEAPGGVVEVDTTSGKHAAKPSAAQPESKKAAPKHEAKKSVATQDYVVQKGDTLASIARKKLGKNGKWQDIVAVNGSALNDPAALSPGTTIKIPRSS
jgi:nucleoid-associated protein YgaU